VTRIIRRAILAARLSKLSTEGEDGPGLDTQDARARAFCERAGKAYMTRLACASARARKVLTL